MRHAVDLDAGGLRVAGGLMLGAGALLTVLPDGTGLPCPLRTLTGVPCPLCGMTTSVVETLRLDLADAFAANPAGIAAVVAAVALLAFRPERLRIPAPVIYSTLASMWIFELYRFSIL